MILSFQPCCSNCAASIKLKLPFFTIDFFPTSKNSVQFCTWYRILYDLNLYVTGSISTIFYISLLFLILCLTWIVVIPFKWGFTNASSLKLHPMVVSCCDTSPTIYQNNGKNGTPKEDSWWWCHHFCPDQVPPSIHLDQGEEPKPQELPEA